MFDRAELKRRAKDVLSRYYLKILVACVLVNVGGGIVLGICTKKFENFDFSAMTPIKMIIAIAIALMMSAIGIALIVFVINPLKVGLKKFMLETAQGNTRFEILLDPFKEGYANIVLVQFMRNLFVCLWSLLGIVPIVILELMFNVSERMAVLVNLMKTNDIKAAVLFVGWTMLIIISAILFSIPSIIKDLQYAMVPYILADNPHKKWRDTLSASKEMMSGNKWGYVKLVLSFTLWFVAAYLCCCIGIFSILPYVEATFAELYRELTGKNNTSYGWQD